ncbi:hypothetical protein CW708_03210, partial [Candidatus Bathyarchaeota archaeon]
IVRKTVQDIVPWRNIAKYAFAAAIMGITLYKIPHPTRITTTIGVTIAGGILYAAVLLIVDKEARKLLKDIITELRKEIKGLLGSAGKKMKK